jgi:hypothetical protein
MALIIVGHGPPPRSSPLYPIVRIRSKDTLTGRPENSPSRKLGSSAWHGTGSLLGLSAFKVSRKKRSLEKPNAWVAAVPANSATPPGARQHRSGAPASRADRARVREAAPQPSRVHPLRQSPVWLEVKAAVVSDFSSASRRPYLAPHDANRTLFKISRVIIRYLLQRVRGFEIRLGRTRYQCHARAKRPDPTTVRQRGRVSKLKWRYRDGNLAI